jgi:hypothetical protein
MNNFAQLRVRHSARSSIDDQYLLYIGMVQALKQDPLPDHARGSSDDCFNMRTFVFAENQRSS